MIIFSAGKAGGLFSKEANMNTQEKDLISLLEKIETNTRNIAKRNEIIAEKIDLIFANLQVINQREAEREIKKARGQR